MNPQAFTNALRAITGEPRHYPEHKDREPWKVAIEQLDSFALTLQATGYLLNNQEIAADKSPDELQARIEMRVNELRELITTGEITP